jgi:hypothetical protein
LMAVCSGIKRNGGRCTAVVPPEQTYCYQHDPARETERRRNAAKGGKGKVSRRVAPLWNEVREVIKGVEAGRLIPSQGNSMLRGFGVLIELARLEVEQSELEIAQRRLELDEQERLEVVRRLEELEEAMSTRDGRGQWGA